MSDNIPLVEQQACVSLTEDHDDMKYYLFTNVCTENNSDEKQLVLYIYGNANGSSVKYEKEKLGLVKVKSGIFSWPYPRGDIVTAVVTTGDFSCIRKQKTSKLTSTKLQDKLKYKLPSSNATEYTIDLNILDQERKLVELTNVKVPIWPKKTKEGAEHDDKSTSSKQGVCNC